MTSSKLETKREQRKAFVLLKRMCRAHTKLPSSYVIGGGIECEGSRACALGGAADVWKGRYDGKPVAIKSLRICWPQPETEDDTGKGGKKVGREMRRLMQVRLLIPPLSKARKVNGYATEILSRSCHLEAPFSPEPPPVPRCQRDVVPPCNGIRMDGTWDGPPICQTERGDESAETGMCFWLLRTCPDPLDT